MMNFLPLNGGSNVTKAATSRDDAVKEGRRAWRESGGLEAKGFELDFYVFVFLIY